MFLLEHLCRLVHVKRGLRPDVGGEVKAGIDGELQDVPASWKMNRRALRGVRRERQHGSLGRAGLVPVVVVKHRLARGRVNLVLGGCRQPDLDREDTLEHLERRLRRVQGSGVGVDDVVEGQRLGLGILQGLLLFLALLFALTSFLGNFLGRWPRLLRLHRG